MLDLIGGATTTQSHNSSPFKPRVIDQRRKKGGSTLIALADNYYLRTGVEKLETKNLE
jgi:hypothetical protein